MKSFKDLQFKPHGNGRPGSVQARMNLGNGYTLSVVAGKGPRLGSSDKDPFAGHGLYNDEGTYEIAVFDGGGGEWRDKCQKMNESAS